MVRTKIYRRRGGTSEAIALWSEVIRIIRCPDISWKGIIVVLDLQAMCTGMVPWDHGKCVGYSVLEQDLSPCPDIDSGTLSSRLARDCPERIELA